MVDVSNDQISFRRMLTLIHLVRALLDCDAVPLSQDANQFGFFALKDLLERAHLGKCCVHAISLARAGRYYREHGCGHDSPACES